MRVEASKVGEIRYAGILVGENWNDDIPGQGGREEVEAGEETVRWRRQNGQNGCGQGSSAGPQVEGQRNVSDRPRPQGKRSMPVPPSHPNPSRTTSYPSTIATTSQLSSGTSTSLSPLTPTDQDRSPIDFNPRSHSIISPTTQTSFGILRHTGPGARPLTDKPVRDERKGHRPTSSVSDRMKQFENGTIGSHASQASRWVIRATGKDEARDMLKREQSHSIAHLRTGPECPDLLIPGRTAYQQLHLYACPHGNHSRHQQIIGPRSEKFREITRDCPCRLRHRRRSHLAKCPLKAVVRRSED